jgi:hypothetical protein
MTFSLIGDFTTASYDLAGGVPREDSTVLKFQPVLPFKAWGVANILRMTLPYEVSGPGNGGLGDVTFFDMAVFGRSWGRLGVGVVASFASSASNPPSHASAGPAIGFVAPVSRKLSVGLFTRICSPPASASRSSSRSSPISLHGWSLPLRPAVRLRLGTQRVVSRQSAVIGKVQRLGGQPCASRSTRSNQGSARRRRFKTVLTVSLLVVNVFWSLGSVHNCNSGREETT